MTTITKQLMTSKAKTDALKKAAEPLMKYLADKHHPHVKVIVTSTNAELLEGIVSTGESLEFIND